jgi:DtxR family Mn-dependent transcriptional regulator
MIDRRPTRRTRPPNPAAEGAPRITHAMEDYLKGVYRLQQEGGSVTTQALAEELGISGPSVTNMVKRLNELRLVEHTPYHGVRLTPAGEKIALEVLRHHRLLELYLAETLGYPWDQVHDEAERLEHHLSEELEARLDSALGHPTRDPHGDPIPSREGTIAAVPGTRLADLEAGAQGIVSRVSDRDPEQLRYLGDLGLYPGVEVVVVERLPFDGPLRIRVAGREHVIGRPLAGAVNVAGGERGVA